MVTRPAGMPLARRLSGRERPPGPPTEVEALKNINNVVHMVVESMLEHGEFLPEEPIGEVEVTIDPRVAVTV